MKMIIVPFLLCLYCAYIFAQVRVLKRDGGLPEDLKCNRSSPCAWEMYEARSFQKRVVEYIKSPCSCPNDTNCEYGYDNLSIFSFVHLCKPVQGNSTTTSSE